ncbi:MAG TPA: hypothetical protein EYQ63_11805, partial [Fuerstia sp.]|nr:hypothetical protein [Fuerstiella sp.]
MILRDVCAVATAESIEAALCDDGDFDAAVVHSPADARRATEAGKHILLDAPISQSVKAAESLLNLVEQAGVVLAVGRLPRHSPANQAIIDRLSSGKLGEPGLLRVHRWSSEPEQSLAAKTFGHLELALHLFDANPT